MQTYVLKITVGVGVGGPYSLIDELGKVSTYEYEKFEERIEFKAKGMEEAEEVAARNVKRLKSYFFQEKISFKLTKVKGRQN